MWSEHAHVNSAEGFPAFQNVTHTPLQVSVAWASYHTLTFGSHFNEVIGFIISSPCARDTFLLEGRSLHDDPPLTLVHQSWSEDVHERKGQGGRDGASYGTRKSFWGRLRKGRENPGPGQLFTPRDTSIQTYDFYTAVLELDDFHDFCCI